MLRTLLPCKVDSDGLEPRTWPGWTHVAEMLGADSRVAEPLRVLLAKVVSLDPSTPKYRERLVAYNQKALLVCSSGLAADLIEKDASGTSSEGPIERASDRDAILREADAGGGSAGRAQARSEAAADVFSPPPSKSNARKTSSAPQDGGISGSLAAATPQDRASRPLADKASPGHVGPSAAAGGESSPAPLPPTSKSLGTPLESLKEKSPAIARKRSRTPDGEGTPRAGKARPTPARRAVSEVATNAKEGTPPESGAKRALATDAGAALASAPTSSPRATHSQAAASAMPVAARSPSPRRVASPISTRPSSTPGARGRTAGSTRPSKGAAARRPAPDERRPAAPPASVDPVTSTGPPAAPSPLCPNRGSISTHRSGATSSPPAGASRSVLKLFPLGGDILSRRLTPQGWAGARIEWLTAIPLSAMGLDASLLPPEMVQNPNYGRLMALVRWSDGTATMVSAADLVALPEAGKALVVALESDLMRTWPSAPE